MASSPSGKNLDISQVASEMGVTIINTNDLVQAIMARQSVLPPRKSRAEEMN